MSEPTQQRADDAGDMPTLADEQPRSKVSGLVVAGIVAICVIVIAGSVMMKKDASGTIKRQAEEFALRNSRTPEPPAAERVPSPPSSSTAKPSGVDKETERRMQEMAQQMAAAEMARRAEAERLAQEEQKKKIEDAQKKLEARKKSAILISSQSSGTSASTDKAPPPQATDPFARLLAHREALSAATAADAPPANEPYGFVPATTATKIEAAAAVYSGAQTYRINQGKFIAAVLETAIQSDLPGMIRAVVREDVYSEDGKQVLVPAGSRIVGEYRSGLVRGQTRVAVIWHRVSRPDGVDITIASPGTDSLGVAGLTGDVDSHFFARFSGSVLLSLIDVYGKSKNNQTVEVVGSDMKDASTIALQNSINIPPTVHVDQGTPIKVFVARDLSFQAIAAQGLTMGS